MAGSRRRDAQPALQPLRLGDALRPIVLGRGASASEPGIELHKPELSLGVTPGGSLLGYALIDNTHGRPLGGLTTAPGLSLDAAQTLMTSAALQLALYGVPRPAHHCVLLVEPDAPPAEIAARQEAFLSAIRPLTDHDLCEIAYVRDHERMVPPLTQRGLVASAGGAALSALEHAGIPLAGATLALHQAGEAAHLLAEQLSRRGMRVIADGDRALRAGADLLLVDGPVWRLEPRRAQTLRARLIVALGPLLGSDAVEHRLAERAHVIVPDTIASAGALLVSHLRDEGYDEDAAVGRSFTLARAIAADALQRAGDTALPVFVRTLARQVIRSGGAEPGPGPQPEPSAAPPENSATH